MKPILFTFFSAPIYSYPLFIGMSFGLAYFLGGYLIEKNKGNKTGFNFLFLGIFINSWIGAKLFYLLHSDLSFAGSTKFWLGGGFVFYGGLIFASLFSLFYCLVLKKFKLGDLVWALPVLPLAHGFGRIGCFLTGCCFGKSCDFFSFLNARHPVQLYESFLNFILFYILLKIQSYKKIESIFYYFIFYSIQRFILEFFRGDLIRGFYFGFSSAQLTSVLLLIISSLLLLRYQTSQTQR